MFKCQKLTSKCFILNVKSPNTYLDVPFKWNGPNETCHFKCKKFKHQFGRAIQMECSKIKKITAANEAKIIYKPTVKL